MSTNPQDRHPQGTHPQDTPPQRMMLGDGDVEIIRIVEWQGAFAPGPDLVPDLPAETWQEHADWLAPAHFERTGGQAVGALQTWVLRVGGRTVVVDTGVGDGRERPGTPLFHRRKEDLLGPLARAGIHPEDVDTVINTHLHVDHVGWNTHRAGNGEWVPTFPNAEYLLPAADDAYYGPANSYAGGGREDDRLMYEDSIAPVHKAGQSVLWEDTHRIDEHLTLEAAPGHSPGSSVLRLAFGSDRAVFVGDLLHSPVQVLHPSCNSCFCLAPAEAAASRRRILERAADEGELVIPAHFAGAGALEVRRSGTGFALNRWATYTAP